MPFAVKTVGPSDAKIPNDELRRALISAMSPRFPPIVVSQSEPRYLNLSQKLTVLPMESTSKGCVSSLMASYVLSMYCPCLFRICQSRLYSSSFDLVSRFGPKVKLSLVSSHSTGDSQACVSFGDSMPSYFFFNAVIWKFYY